MLNGAKGSTDPWFHFVSTEYTGVVDAKKFEMEIHFLRCNQSLRHYSPHANRDLRFTPLVEHDLPG